MSTYKLIQDIEAEDHILGPLSLRQFIYALVAVFCFYMSFIGLSKHVWPLLAMFLPIGLLAGFFAFPFGKDQPTEVWALAKLRFLFKPRKRIWDQSGVKEMVTITVPKKVERVYTNGLSQTEVKSRLRALADTIDSRGWVTKNVSVNMYSQQAQAVAGSSDRLIDIGNLPAPVPDYDVTASDDILDEQASPVARQFNQMIGASTQAHRQQLTEELSAARQAGASSGASGGADYWFLNQPAQPPHMPTGNVVAAGTPLVAPGASSAMADNAQATNDEVALLKSVKQRGNAQAYSLSRMHTIQPISSQSSVISDQSDSSNAQSTDNRLQNTGRAQPDPAILELANNNDLSVATLARQARRAKGGETNDGEVVIPLH